MKPIKLSIEGVFSYQEKQIIDFEKLSKGGIFGIFGKTGSGKSSIIEAIIFVLYDRLDKISGNKVDLINLQSDKAVIEFEFESFGKQYLATSITKRTPRGQTTKRQFYVKEDGNYRAVSEDVTPEDIIGLSYDNFCRIVIIPQGKFQEFFSLTESQRTAMLKEIFPLLTQYDLNQSLKKLREQAKEILDTESGQLQQLSEYTEEGLKTKQEESEAVKQKYETIKTQYEKQKALADEFEKLFSDFNKLQTATEEKEKLDKQTVEIDRSRKELDEYEVAINRFQVPISSYENTQRLFADNQTKLQETDNRLESLEKQYIETRKIYEDLFEQDKKTPEQKEEIRKIGMLVSLRKEESEVATKRSKLQSEKERQAKGERICQEEENKKIGLESLIKEKESKRLNPVEFSAVRNWFWQKKNTDDAIAQLNGEYNELEKQKQDLLASIGISAEENIELFLQDKFAKLQKQIQDCENKKEKYIIEQALCRFSEKLEDNKPCPLCGSISHPSPVNLVNVDSHLNQINSQLKSLETDLKSLENSIKDLNLINKQIEQKFKELENKKAEVKAYEVQFVWSKYKGKTFEDIAEMEKADNALQQEINGLRKEADKVVGDLSRYTAALNGIKDTIKSIDIEIATAEGKIGQLNQEIDSDLKAKYADYEENRLNEICEKLNQEIEKRNQELAERNQELEKQNKEIIEAKTVRENYVKNIEGYSLELQKYEEELKGLLIECGFDNLERVKEVLNKKLDVAFLRKKIENFNWQKQTNAQRLKELSELTFGKQRPSEERLSELKAESKRGSEQLEEILEQKGKIEAEVKTFVQKLEEKQKLQERYGKLEIRLNAMDELLSLFKGDKFVHFISTIYLEQLCAKANERFRIITQNKFEICYSDKNFEIIDYLNEGKKRSIKTLSGGQMFQASLCMALALVDTIRLSHNSNQNFFFIDEGFGTQDTESLELIFESLKALRGENKTVGLISHNETLKEKISGNISVRFKNNKGSVIETNYL